MWFHFHSLGGGEGEGREEEREGERWARSHSPYYLYNTISHTSYFVSFSQNKTGRIEGSSSVVQMGSTA